MRKLYFVLALISAGCFTFGGLAGMGHEVYQLAISDPLNPPTSSTAEYIGWLITSVGAIGYLLFSFLFVREDDKEDTDEE